MSPMVRRPLTMEYALLGMLIERPRHGYKLHQALADPGGLGLIWNLKHSQLYALLGKLEADGYLTARLKPQETRPTRRVYRLTRSGRAAFRAWVRTPVLHGRAVRQEFLAKLYFAERDGPDAVLTLVEQQKAVVREWLVAQPGTEIDAGAEQRAAVQRKGSAVKSRAATSYRWLVGRFRMGQIEAILDWLNLLPGVTTGRKKPRRAGSPKSEARRPSSASKT